MLLQIVRINFIKPEVFRNILEKHKHKHQCFDELHFVCIKLNHEGTERLKCIYLSKVEMSQNVAEVQ